MVLDTFKDAFNGFLSSWAFYIALGFAVLIVAVIVALIASNRNKKK